MRLLSKKETADKKREEQEKAFETGEVLNKFVAAETKKLNQLRETYRKEKEQLQTEAEIFFKELSDLKSERISEIAALEQRKKIIEESSDEQYWTNRHTQILAKETEVNEREKSLTEQKERLDSKETEIVARANELERVEQELSEREVGTQKQEKELFLTRESLELAKHEHRLALESAEQEFSEREQILQEKEREAELLIKANEAIRAELETQRKEIEQDRRAIRDGYENLARARKEILGRDD